MSRRGRKPLGAEHVTQLAGSETACERLRLIVRALAGELSVPDACAALGIGESRFHQLRQEALQAALAALEPRPAGRPSRPPEPGAARIAELERELRDLRCELQACRIREDLADVLPGNRKGPVKKTTPQQLSRRRPPVPSPPPEVRPC